MIDEEVLYDDNDLIDKNLYDEDGLEGVGR